jgi:two-component system, NarL family, nitrate/nitrite response regulator NarL
LTSPRLRAIFDGRLYQREEVATGHRSQEPDELRQLDVHDDRVAQEDANWIRVLVVVRTRLYRQGLADALRTRSGIAVVGAVASHEDAVARVSSDRPDVILLDADLVGDAARLVAAAPDCRVVALAVDATEKAVIPLAEAGVAGFISRDHSIDELVAELERVSRGETVASQEVTGLLLRRVFAAVNDAPSPDLRARLTKREREIMDLVEGGLSNKEIARTLSIQLATVKNHVHNALRKLEVGGRAEAAALVQPARSSAPGP